MLSFLLNRELTPRTIAADATLTVLEYLRQEGLVGSKEGCASGDCGACTVALAKDDGGKLRYEAVNSCICSVAALHGRHLISVEGLADGGALHPAQQEMVNHHASQCGFCTPGFVISIFTHGKTGGDATTEALSHRLGGNLCRCTGYRPIRAAAAAFCQNRRHDWFDKQEKQTLTTLHQLRRTRPDEAPLFFAPRNIAQLATLRQTHPQARLLAGGTDIMLEVTQQLRRFNAVIDLGGVTALSAVREDKRQWVVGAMATYADLLETLATHPQLHDFCRLLLRFGSMQVRARATVGGNIANASPIADGPPVFLALGASLILRCGGEKRQLSLEKFYLGYKKTALRAGEFIESIIIPKPQKRDVFRAYKISKRMEDDISAVCVAVKYDDDDGVIRNPRIAFGGMKEIPARATHCEKAWDGAHRNDDEDDEKTRRALAADFQPISDVRASAAYRAAVAVNLLRKARDNRPPLL